MGEKTEENILTSLPSFEEFLKTMYAEIEEKSKGKDACWDWIAK